MLLARISGTVTATIKVDGLQGHRLLIADLLSTSGEALTASIVAADSLGAGIGDTVLLATGSAVRQQAQYSGCSIDACTVAIVDQVTRPDGFNNGDAANTKSSSAKRNSAKPAAARKISARKTAAKKTSTAKASAGTTRKTASKKKQSKSRARKTG